MPRRDLKQLMNARNPLAPREVVQPVDLYTPPDPASKEATQAGGSLASQQTSNLPEQLPSKPANQQASNSTAGPKTTDGSHKTSKQVKKFASYLRPESLKALKLIALQEDKNDYEILQEAVDLYLDRKRAVQD